MEVKMKNLMNFLRRLFCRRYIDIQTINNLKKHGITPVF